MPMAGPSLEYQQTEWHKTYLCISVLVIWKMVQVLVLCSSYNIITTHYQKFGQPLQHCCNLVAILLVPSIGVILLQVDGKCHLNWSLG